MQLRNFCILLVLLAVSFIQIKGSNETCSTSMNNIVNTIKTYQLQNETQKIFSLPIVAYSGKDLNDLGEFELCRKAQNSSYITLNLQIGGVFLFASSFYFGLCGPADCTAQDFQSATVQSTLQSAIGLISNISGLNVSSLFAVATITAMEPNGTPELTVASLMAFLIVGIPVVLVIASSIHTTLKTRRENAAITNQSNDHVDASRGTTHDNNDSYQALKDNSTTVVTAKTKEVSKFECWAIQRNLKQLLFPEKNPKHDSNLLIFNGIRFFSILWVILGHCYPTNWGYLKNYQDIVTLMSQTFMDVVLAGYFAVDAFFFLGGFFAAYVLYSKLKSMKFGVINYASIIFHRVLRILPLYIFIIMFYWKIAGYLGNGPLWGKFLEGAAGCDSGWWKNILFIESRYGNVAVCVPWGWYLSNDFDMFLACPFIVWVYLKSPKLGTSLVMALIAGSLALGLYYAIAYNVYAGLDISLNSAWTGHAYGNPLVRAPPYLVGVLLALLYRTFKEGDQTLKERLDRIRASVKLSWALELIGIGILSAMVWMIDPVKLDRNKWPNWLHKSYVTLDRFLFAIGLTLLVLPTLAGAKTLIRSILSARLWAPLATLSFGMYLVHEILIAWWQFSTRHTFYQNFIISIKDTAIFSVVSTFAALITYLIIEAPAANMEATTREGASKKEKQYISLQSSTIGAETLKIKSDMLLNKA